MNRWCDGFGRYGGTKSYMLNGSSGQAWAEVGGDWALSSANPRTGTHHLRLTDGLTQLDARRVFGEALTEVFFGFAIHCEALPNTEPSPGGSEDGFFLARIADAANATQVTIVLGTDGSLVAYRGGSGNPFNGVLLERSDPCIGAGAYQHIEFYAKAGNGTDGALEIRVDEVTRLNLTGIDTVVSANVSFSQFSIGRFSGRAFENTTDYVDIADVFCNDTVNDGSGCHTFIGDCKSGVLMVNADTGQADFDLSTGVIGYDLLDDKPPNDATYISTDSELARSDFGIENGPASLTEILTARPFVRAWKDDAGTCQIAPSMASNGDVAIVDPQPVATAPSYYDSNVPFDPDTSAPWTLEGINAALEVVERDDGVT